MAERSRDLAERCNSNDLEQIHPRITAISSLWGKGGHLVLYLVKGARYALIDAGANDTPERAIVPALQQLGLDLTDVAAILNTHDHADHVGGNAFVQRVSKAKVYFPKNEIPAMRGGYRGKANFFRELREFFGAEGFESKVSEDLEWCGGGFRIHRRLDEGDVVDLGEGVELKVVALPGHTPGSIGYLWDKEGILLAGDAVMARGPRPGGIPIISDSRSYEASAARLMGMPIEMLCSYHRYLSFQLPAAAVRTGRDVNTFLEDSIYVIRELREAARRAVAAEPGAPLRVAGERFIQELPASFEVAPLDRAFPAIWPVWGLHSLIREAKAGIVPPGDA